MSLILNHLLVIAILVLLFFVWRRVAKKRRRAGLMRKALPKAWVDIIYKRVALFRQLPKELHSQLYGLINVMLAEKVFEGCAGLVITDEVRLVIAAEACILLLNRKPTFFPKVDAILVYPTAYVAEKMTRVGPMQMPERQVRLGESWMQGLVVLAWDRVERDAAGGTGRNVVLHEFAHQLDCEDGVSDGTPILQDRELFRNWVRVLSHDYLELCAETEEGKVDVIDEYGATNAAEFFAVATETFFMQPAALQAHHAQLFDVLKNYYHIDPLKFDK